MTIYVMRVGSEKKKTLHIQPSLEDDLFPKRQEKTAFGGDGLPDCQPL